MDAFGIIFLAVLGFGSLTGLYGLFLLVQQVVFSRQNIGPKQRKQSQWWIVIWAVGGVAELVGSLLRSAARGKAGTWPQYETLGALLIGLGPMLWPIVVFVLRPHGARFERPATPREQSTDSVWPPPPSNRKT